MGDRMLESGEMATLAESLAIEEEVSVWEVEDSSEEVAEEELHWDKSLRKVAGFRLIRKLTRSELD
jgi:hypothetical protein